MARDAATLARAQALLEAKFGAPLASTEAFPFAFTSYYASETGPAAVKKFLVFSPAPSDLAGWKRWSGGVEAGIAAEDRSVPRPVNVDPGYLTLGNLVLASTKEAFHRVYLGGGIFAEVELVWQGKLFEPLPWTYADYRTPEALSFFDKTRETLKQARRSALRGGA